MSPERVLSVLRTLTCPPSISTNTLNRVCLFSTPCVCCTRVTNAHSCVTLDVESHTTRMCVSCCVRMVWRMERPWGVVTAEVMSVPLIPDASLHVHGMRVRCAARGCCDYCCSALTCLRKYECFTHFCGTYADCTCFELLLGNLTHTQQQQQQQQQRNITCHTTQGTPAAACSHAQTSAAAAVAHSPSHICAIWYVDVCVCQLVSHVPASHPVRVETEWHRSQLQPTKHRDGHMCVQCCAVLCCAVAADVCCDVRHGVGSVHFDAPIQSRGATRVDDGVVVAALIVRQH